MRVAIVSPYSWSYPGGVNRHVEALAGELIGRGHELRVLAPVDPADRLTSWLHRAEPQPRRLPEYLVTLGRSVALGANGAVSNLGMFGDGVIRMRRELRAFDPDVVHVHEPLAPLLGADACSFRGAPVVGTFHAYSTKPVPNQLANLGGARRKLNQLSARIAVSEAAAWTGRRWFGGSYTVIPNGVDTTAPPSGPKAGNCELELLFVGRAEERKGLPVLLRAFAALVEHVPARLAVIGVEPDELRAHVADPEVASRIEARGRVPRERLWQALHDADVLCAPSLAGESFGMILTEAFAAGTPVVASDIPGYAGVVTDGVDGVLVPAANPQRLAEEIRSIGIDADRRERMGVAARASAQGYAWPRVTERVEAVYTRACEQPAPEGASLEALARRAGLVPIDGSAPVRARKLESLEPASSGTRRARLARRAALTVAGLLGLALSVIAARRIGVDNVVASIVRSDLTWVLVATALMSASLFCRAGSWFWIARSALADAPLRRRDVTSATMIGVLMSATLPARLGEPARAMVLARRVGRMRETLPVLLGTLVSQTLLNVAALAILGVLIVTSSELFDASSERLFVFSLAPLAVLISVLLAPAVLREPGSGRVARVVRTIRGALLRVRSGLAVFSDPRRGPAAAVAQLGAWGLQLLACFALFTALGLDHEPGVGIGAAAAVLFAVNVTAAIPVTPSNIGVFQLATLSVLTTGFGVSAADALAYGVILQAVEIATAVALGLPALVREGVTWQDMRLRALGSAPVRLRPAARPTQGAG